MAKEKLRLDPETGEFVNVLTETGQEIPDPTPMAPPIGFERRDPLHMRIRAMVEHAFRERQDQGYESMEEADDFVIGDEDDPRYGERFAMMPGHEHEWEENYEPPRDFKDMHERLVKAGWTPPEEPKDGQEVSSVKPSDSEVSKKPLDDPKASKNG